MHITTFCAPLKLYLFTPLPNKNTTFNYPKVGNMYPHVVLHYVITCIELCSIILTLGLMTRLNRVSFGGTYFWTLRGYLEPENLTSPPLWVLQQQ